MTLASPEAAVPPSATEEGRAAAVAAARLLRARRTRRRLAMVAVILLAAVGFLLYKGLTSGIVYFKTLNQAVADRASLGNATFQLEGVVAPHSLRTSGTNQQFALCSGSLRVPVHNVGSPPQLFAAGVAVVLVGHFVGSGDLFASNQILVKHSNSYVAAHPGRIQAGDDQRC